MSPGDDLRAQTVLKGRVLVDLETYEGNHHVNLDAFKFRVCSEVFARCSRQCRDRIVYLNGEYQLQCVEKR